VLAEEFSFYFKTSPRLELLRPLDEVATLSVLVTAADGKPVNQAWIEVRLEAPKPGRLFSTDFPLVEGSRLIEMRLPLRQGKTEWKYVFPIRGEYRLDLDLVTVDGKKASKAFPFEIRENRKKWLLLGLFTLALFAFGVVAGRLFTSSVPSHARKVAACLLLVNGWGMSTQLLAAQEGGKAYFGRLEIEPATVGKPSAVRWRLEGDGGARKPTVALTLMITHLEEEKTVFSIERIPVAEEFAMNFHFTDGAAYRVTAIANVPGRGVKRTEQNLSVSGVEPPTGTMIPAILFFLTVIAFGLVAGRWSKTRRAKR
jgi:hypothetical protein